MLIKLISEGKLTEAEELFKSQLSEKASELVGSYKDAAYASLFESFLIEKEEPAEGSEEDEEDEMEGDEEPVEESEDDDEESEDDEDKMDESDKEESDDDSEDDDKDKEEE